MTDLIDRRTGTEFGLYRERHATVVESGSSTWPHVERRRGPRRNGDSVADRRSRQSIVPADLQVVEAAAARRNSGSKRADSHVSACRRQVLAVDIVVPVLCAISAYLVR